jgi:hypothetical protein
MGDLDDLDLQPKNEGPDEFDENFEPVPESPSRPDDSGIHPAIPALVVAVILGGLYLVFRALQPQSEAAPVATTPSPAAAATATVMASKTPPPIDLPPLNASDLVIRGWVKALSANPDLAKWLIPDQLVRRFVAAVDNIAEDEDPIEHIRHLAPPTRFAAMGPAKALVADPRSFRRFDSFVRVVESLDATAAARLYLNLGPLFDGAYAELGHAPGEFDRTFARALARLLATPASPHRFELVRQKVSFAFADPRLEALAPAQKMLLRLGPDHRVKVQQKLEEFRAALEGARGATTGVPPPK